MAAGSCDGISTTPAAKTLRPGTANFGNALVPIAQGLDHVDLLVAEIGLNDGICRHMRG